MGKVQLKCSNMESNAAGNSNKGKKYKKYDCRVYSQFLFFSFAALKCCLHIGTASSTENVIQFTESSIQTCREKKAIRDNRKKRKSKYDVIVLPDVIDQTTGYHPSCFRNYCSVTLVKTDSSSSLMSVGSENDLDEAIATTVSESENDLVDSMLISILKHVSVYLSLRLMYIYFQLSIQSQKTAFSVISGLVANEEKMNHV